MEYFFEDFTEAKYVDVLRRIKDLGYRIVAYSDYRHNENALLLRHDVDISVYRALRLAELEHEEGICSTFCLLFHSSFYNLLEKETIKKVKRIAYYGHHIGLHFYPAYYDLEYSGIQYNSIFVQKLSEEKRYLEDLFECAIDMFSFHNPEEGNWISCEDNEIDGMVNSYGSFLKENYDYISDSNGYWRFERLSDFLGRKHTSIQLLLHPEWWTPEVMTPFERIRSCVDAQCDYVLAEYDRILKTAGRANVR